MTKESRRPRVLIVDDEDGIRELQVMAFEMAGFETLEADNGEKALAHLRDPNTQSDPIDAVISDLRMPGMDGNQLIEAIQSEWKDESPVVILVTAFMHGAFWDFYLKGVDCVFLKPCDFSRVVNRVRRALEAKDRYQRYDNPRKWERLRLPENLPINFESLQAKQKGIVSDISEGGMLVQGLKDVKVGEEIEFVLTSDSPMEKVKGQARVQWSGKPGFGVSFLELNQVAKKNLGDVINRLKTGDI